MEIIDLNPSDKPLHGLAELIEITERRIVEACGLPRDIFVTADLNTNQIQVSAPEIATAAISAGKTYAQKLMQAREFSVGVVVSLKQEIENRAAKRGMTLSDREIDSIAKGLTDYWGSNYSQSNIDTMLDLIDRVTAEFRGALAIAVPKPVPEESFEQKRSKHKGKPRQRKSVKRKNGAPVIRNPGMQGK